MTKGKYDFKGGDNLTGIKYDYHAIMMENELGDGRKAYKFSWAKTKKSGPSFGGNQMDIARNEYGRKVLLDVIKNAVNRDGLAFLDDKSIKEVEQILQKPEQMKGKSASLFDSNKSKIEAALASGYGKQKIDEAYVEVITQRAEAIEKFVTRLKDGPGKSFAQSRAGKCYIFYYATQYGLSIDRMLYKHLSGEEVRLKTGKIIPAFGGDKFTRESFQHFLTELKYYEKHSKDEVRRLNNIDKYLQKQEKPKNSNLKIDDDCAKIYKAYSAYVKSAKVEGGMSLDELAREFNRKYPEGSILDVCTGQGIAFGQFLPDIR